MPSKAEIRVYKATAKRKIKSAKGKAKKTTKKVAAYTKKNPIKAVAIAAAAGAIVGRIFKRRK